ncbi:MAG: cytochrome P460 family protein [Pseudomonadota bacterium]
MSGMKVISALIVAGSVALTGLIGTTASHAADVCKIDVEVDDLTPEQAQSAYDCMIDGLLAGWQKGGHPVAAEYKTWTAAASYPAAVGTHGNRLLFTYVNDIGKEQYLKFEEEGVTMPVGSILAKESFNAHTKGDKIGQLRAGPLFLMEKVAPGTFDETDNWKYTLITPGGKAWLESGVTEPAKVQNACHECHSLVLEDQDAMYYPDWDARVATN